MTLEETPADLERHAHDFAERAGFTYTVLAVARTTCSGCIYHLPRPRRAARCRGGLVGRTGMLEFDRELHRTVSRWLADCTRRGRLSALRGKQQPRERSSYLTRTRSRNVSSGADEPGGMYAKRRLVRPRCRAT